MRIVFTLFLFMVATALAGQTLEQETNHRFPQLPASVRGAALGGAALAEDPAAVQSNPTAIAGLASRVVFVSAAATSYDSNLLKSDGDRYWNFPESHSAVAVNSMMVAMPAGPLALAAWYRRDPRVRIGDPFALRAVRDGAVPRVDCFIRSECGLLLVADGTSALREETRYGGAAAWRRGTVSIGAAAEVVDVHERVETPRVITDSHTFERRFDQLQRVQKDRDVVLHGGVSWQATPKILLALSYSEGGSFQRETTVCDTRVFDSFECSSPTVTVNVTTVKRPDALRAAVALRPVTDLLVALEAVRRDYRSFSLEPYTWFTLPIERPYRVATEVHGGLEYTLRGRIPVALRAGWWRDPRRTDSPAFQTAMSAENVDHVTLGAGIPLNKTVLDVAIDSASRTSVRTVVIGLSQRF